MPAQRHAERESCVRVFNRLAVARGIERIATNAGRVQVNNLISAIETYVGNHGWGAEAADETSFRGAVATYTGTWPARADQVPEQAGGRSMAKDAATCGPPEAFQYHSLATE